MLDCTFTHAIFASNIPARPAISANRHHLIVRQPRLVLSHPSSLAIFCHAITPVFLFGSKKEMTRIDAARVVARMTYVKRRRNITPVRGEHYTMGALLPLRLDSNTTDLRITISVPPRGTLKAARRRPFGFRDYVAYD
jgi:hypothetical protein